MITVTRAWAPDRRRSLLQPREERLLRRHALLPRRARTSWCSAASTAIPTIQRNWANANIQGRSGRSKSNKPRLRDVRRRAAELAHRRRSSSTTSRTRSSTRQGFMPFGEVTSGMSVVDKINPTARREARTRARCRRTATRYLEKDFPEARLHQEGDDRAVALHRRRRSRSQRWT